MSKKIILIIAGLLLLLPLSAQTQKMKSEYVFAKVYRAGKDPAKYTDPAKAKELLQKRSAVVAELGALKKKLVRENAELGKLQAEFDSCLVELGKKIAAKDAVKTVRNRIDLLEKEAQVLPRTLADREKQLAAARDAVKSSDAKVASEGYKTAEKLQIEIKHLQKDLAEIPARRIALQKELRNTMRRVIRMDRLPEAERMKEISAEMTLLIESTEEAKKINRDLRALDIELNKMLKK